ncbi:MAG TPA: methylmalonyl-CoA mutase [Spirochaetes bacterium]|nr:methylmalonyl-CoA mutase [Spirochaetota bacterium]
MSENLNLRETFAANTREQWEEAALSLLKGKSFESLVRKTYEGIEIQPIYMKENVKDALHVPALPGQAPYVRGERALQYVSRPWKIAQEIPYGDPKEFNEALVYDISRGQDGVTVPLDRATLAGLDPGDAKNGEVGDGGLSLACLEDVTTAFNGVDLEKTALYVNAGPSGIAVTALLAAWAKTKGTSLAGVRGCVYADPLEYLAVHGGLPLSLDDAYDEMAALVKWAKHNAPGLRTIGAGACAFNHSGGSAVQDIAFAVATAVEYMAALRERGLAADDIAAGLSFRFSLGGDFFMEIAKLRAVRLVWAGVIGAFGGSDEAKKVCVNVRTSRFNKTVTDPCVNLLRVTTEAFSGVLGGCDSMHVAPFDEPIGLPDEFSRRVARNLQIMLKEEWNLNKIVDPSGGSWYVEALTDQLAKKAWELFREIEKRGGMYRALREGFPQEAVAGVAGERAKAVAMRRDVYVGTNQYPNLKEQPVKAKLPDFDEMYRSRSGQVRKAAADADGAKVKEALAMIDAGKMVEGAVAAVEAGATLGEISRALRPKGGAVNGVRPLNIHRGAALFEGLRAKTDRFKRKTGGAPKIFMANMGPPARHKARADFSNGFFSVGGFETLGSNGFETPDEAAAAALGSGAGAMVICSTDAAYPDIVPELAGKVKKAKPDMFIILAGYPADHVEAFKDAGVDEFIHVKANLYETLVNLQKKLGVE